MRDANEQLHTGDTLTTLYEYSGNMHMHTPYSDGAASHAEIAQAAAIAGLDFVIVTDHNVWVSGVEGYYTGRAPAEPRRVLLLTGEEIHDRQRRPQVNHLLVFGAACELAHCAADPQGLIDAVAAAGGLSFLAHPDDPDLPRFKEPPIPWVDRYVTGFDGLEIWNFMSSLKTALNGGLGQLVRAAFRPEEVIRTPPAETVALWDSLLAAGRRVTGIGGADAHGLIYRVGPIRHTVFPYDFLFSCVNTHILSKTPFTGEWEADQKIVYKTLKAGSAFIGYDLIGETRGFRFSAHGQGGTALMGGSVRLGAGVTLQARAPDRCHLRLIRHGQVVAEWHGQEAFTYSASQSGAYRVEAWRNYKGQPYTWILSNPIYVEDVNYRAD